MSYSYSKKSSTYSNSNSKSQIQQKKMCCKVCADSGKSAEIINSHWPKEKNGTTNCPTLLSQCCRYCSESGHTIKYCTTKVRHDKLEIKWAYAEKEMEKRNKKEEEEAEKKRKIFMYGNSKSNSKSNSKNLFDILDSDEEQEQQEQQEKEQQKKKETASKSKSKSKSKPIEELSNNVTLRSHQVSYASVAASMPTKTTAISTEYWPITSKTQAAPAPAQKTAPAQKAAKKNSNWADWVDSDDEEEEEEEEEKSSIEFLLYRYENNCIDAVEYWR